MTMMDVKVYGVREEDGQLIGLGEDAAGFFYRFRADEDELRWMKNFLNEQPGPEITFPTCTIDSEEQILAESADRFTEIDSTRPPRDLREAADSLGI